MVVEPITMKYCEIVAVCENLDCREKLRLAQLLIRCARKGEEKNLPKEKLSRKKGKFLKNKNESANDVDSVGYVAKRILLLKPTKKKSLKVAIKAIFLCQGGIAEFDEEKIILELQKRKYIKINSNGHVKYL